MIEHYGALVPNNDPFGPKFTRAVVSFDYGAGAFIARPQRPFRPRGLALYGMPEGSKVRAFIGTRQEVAISYPAIPCAFFYCGYSFEEICRKADAGSELAGWGDWSPVSPGIDITIHIFNARGEDIYDPNMGVCMWGYALSH